MPPKLFEMIVAGFPEERAQLIFDALIHAEERGCQFVNVCLRHDIGFLFSTSSVSAQQVSAHGDEEHGVGNCLMLRS